MANLEWRRKERPPWRPSRSNVYRAMLCYAPMLSVCSHIHIILVFPYQTVWQYSDGYSLTGASNAGIWKNRDFRPIYRFISKMIQDRAIVTRNANGKPYQSFHMNDLQWLQAKFQGHESRYYSTSNNSKTIKDKATYSYVYAQWQYDSKSYVVYRMAPFTMTLNDP